MNTDLITNDFPAVERGVDDWRFQQLLAAGWPERQALVLAAHHDIDLTDHRPLDMGSVRITGSLEDSQIALGVVVAGILAQGG